MPSEKQGGVEQIKATMNVAVITAFTTPSLWAAFTGPTGVAGARVLIPSFYGRGVV